MENCNSCHFSSYSGGQEELAERRKVAIESLGYKYCSKKHEHVQKSEYCNNYKLKIMRKFIFVWYDFQNQRHEYSTEALSSVIAQAQYGTFQAKKKLHKKYAEMFEVVKGERVKL